MLYQKERHHSPPQQCHSYQDNCRRDQTTTLTVYTLLGYTFRLALLSDFHLIFFLLTYFVLSEGRKVRFFFVAADLVNLVFLSLVQIKNHILIRSDKDQRILGVLLVVHLWNNYLSKSVKRFTQASRTT